MARPGIKTKALQKCALRLTLYPLPDNLLYRWQRYNRRAIRPVKLLSYVRHRFTNYDHLRRKFRLDDKRLASFKRMVNQQAGAMLDQWYESYERGR